MPLSEVFNEDNLIGLSRYPDGFFNLAIIDPPYGIGESHKGMITRHHSQKKYTVKDWDNQPPPLSSFRNCLECPKIRLSGVLIILYHASPMIRLAGFIGIKTGTGILLTENWPGLRLIALLGLISLRGMDSGSKCRVTEYTPQKSR